jgi:3-deoxy-manno-octulosonate cytidylyltransferase (CMP-KDO synthetase)
MNASPKILAVIPARYASSRLPGKPLADLAGQPMIVRVWQQAQKIAGLSRIIVATDDDRIAEVVRAAGGEAELTRVDHPSGSDRVWEVAERHPEFDWVLNLQGDEPLMKPANVEAMFSQAMQTPVWDVMTLVTPLKNPQDFHNPNVVKTVMSSEGRVFYCSRSPIPYFRSDAAVKPDNLDSSLDITDTDAAVRPDGLGASLLKHTYRHIGLYLFKRDALSRFTKGVPGPLELLEQLEQLRFLELGFSLHAAVVSEAFSGVDTLDDLHRIAGLFVNFAG